MAACQAVEGVTGRRFSAEQVEKVTRREQGPGGSGLEDPWSARTTHPAGVEGAEGVCGHAHRRDDRRDRQSGHELRAARDLPVRP
jgi:hypothetical protein